MIKIAPSLLAADFANLGRDLKSIATADYVHFDVMDGVFVPNISFGLTALHSIRPATPMPIDAHLMIVQPVRYVERFCDEGADIITVHVEADEPQNIRDALDRIHAKGKRAGIVLKPKTPAECALPYLKDVDMILVMTVEPGFGAQKFMSDMLPKLSTIRAWLERDNPSCELEVDGGVSPTTCRLCVDAGANVLVAGSAVYGASDPAEIAARIAALRGVRAS